jgi:putative restriction endonuclease
VTSGRSTERRGWERDELLLALRVYFQNPFGRLHATNPEIVQLAEEIGRTPSAVAMKASNFASLDPDLMARGIKGLRGASQADRALWAQAHDDLEWFAIESELARIRVSGEDQTQTAIVAPSGETQVEVTINARRVQTFFRSSVLAAYENSCAVTGLTSAALLNAGHIIPWSVDEGRRADPSNGIALNALHDRAFDRGLITFDSSFRMVVSSKLREGPISNFHRVMLFDFEGEPLRIPDQHPPDPQALEYHRESVFQG